MKFPNWAPKYLTEFHRSYLENGNLAAQGRHLAGHGMNAKESDQILLRMLSDGRMEKVWRSLGKRFERRNPDYQHYRFVFECFMGVSHWRHSPKLTTKQRRLLANRIKKYVSDLSQSLSEIGYDGNPLFSHILADRPIDRHLAYFLDQIEHYSKNEVAQTQIPVALPPMHWFLTALCADIDSLISERLLVTKPKSKNAALHFLIRRLNRYFVSKFGQPLHDLVAATSSVVLDLDDVDPDLVRKLTKR